MHARRADPEIPAEVGLGGRLPMDLGIGMDERKVLSLPFGESRGRRVGHGSASRKLFCRGQDGISPNPPTAQAYARTAGIFIPL